MGYAGTVLAAITRMKENRAMQKNGNCFRGDKKDLYFKYPDNGKSTFQAKELTETEWKDLRQRMRRETIRRRAIDVIILMLTMVSVFWVVRWFMY